MQSVLEFKTKLPHWPLDVAREDFGLTLCHRLVGLPPGGYLQVPNQWPVSVATIGRWSSSVSAGRVSLLFFSAFVFFSSLLTWNWSRPFIAAESDLFLSTELNWSMHKEWEIVGLLFLRLIPAKQFDQLNAKWENLQFFPTKLLPFSGAPNDNNYR